MGSTSTTDAPTVAPTTSSQPKSESAKRVAAKHSLAEATRAYEASLQREASDAYAAVDFLSEGLQGSDFVELRQGWQKVEDQMDLAARSFTRQLRQGVGHAGAVALTKSTLRPLRAYREELNELIDGIEGLRE